MRRGPCYDVGCRIQEPVTGASLPANFAMPVAVPSTAGDDAGLAARVAAGPGPWEDWLAGWPAARAPAGIAAGRRDDRRRGRGGARAQAGTGAERRGHGPVPGHRGAVPGPRLRPG